MFEEDYDKPLSAESGTETPNSTKYFDADIITPVHLAAYEGREITVMLALNQFSKAWVRQRLTFDQFIGMFTEHKVGRKEGRAAVFADMVPGRRVKHAVKEITCLSLDIDTGEPRAVLDPKLKQLGCFVIRCSSHSNAKQCSEIRKDELQNFHNGAEEFTTDMIRQFLSVKKQWDGSVVKTLKYVEEVQTEKGAVIRVSHCPMEKHRVILPLDRPYVISEHGQSQAEGWAKWAMLIEALAQKLGVHFDHSCTDPARLYYLPRHDEGRPYNISLFGGPLFDFGTLTIGNAFDRLESEFAKSSRSKSVTPGGKALGKWWMTYAHGFQIMDVIERFAPDKIRTKASAGFNIECPFDSAHSNAGNARDQACFAVNAAETGGNEFFVIKCQHAGCKNKTSLDMLAKMLGDEWFDREVILDPDFNIAEIEDFNSLIEAVKPDSSDAKIEEAIQALLCAGLSTIKFDQAERRLAKKLGTTPSKVKNTVAKVRIKFGADSASATPVRAGVFAYEKRFNFDDAADACKAAVLEVNSKKKLPVVSVMDGYPVLLTITAEGRAKLADMSKVAFWSYLTSLLAFVQMKEGVAGVRGKVPEDVATYVFETCAGWLPPSPTIVYTPTLLPSGSLLETPGYHYKPEHELNHLLILTPDFVMPAIPNPPTREDANTSLNWLRRELLNDFAFLDVDDHGNECRAPAEANALAMLLTPFMRAMISGRTPIFIVNKPKGGTGGSLLAYTPSLIHQGEVATFIRYSDNPEEMNKALITQIRSGTQHLFFDDVRELLSRELLRNITAHKVAGRLLNTNDLVEALNMFNWNASGNNVVVDDQMDRRAVWVRLNEKKADLRNRTFRHSGKDGFYGLTFEEFCRLHRGTIISHILTIILYWIESGERPFTGKDRSGFESWSEKVGGVLEAVGVEGFLQGKTGVLASPEAINDMSFMNEWLANYGTCEVKPLNAFQWARDIGSAILQGSGEDQKKTRFLADLHRLNDNTFLLRPLSGEKAEYEFKLEVGEDGGPAYRLQKVAK